MDCSQSSLHVNVGSEFVDEEHDRSPTNDIVLEDSDDDDDCLEVYNGDVIGASERRHVTDANEYVKIDINEFFDEILREWMPLVNVMREPAAAATSQEVQRRWLFLRKLFTNYNMEPLTFVLLLHDFALELKMAKVIDALGGVVYNSLAEMDGHAVVLVKDDSLHYAHLGAVFKLSYVMACLKSQRLLDITPYLKSYLSKQIKPGFNFMDVVYYKIYLWDTIPDKYIVQNSSNKTKCTGRGDSETVDSISSDDDEVIEMSGKSERIPSPTTPPITKKKFSQKHTRLPYSAKEEEQILRYIIQRGSYDQVKGVLLWRAMESRDVCPTRTWQSMKERFLKRVVYNLNNYKFLTDKQIHSFQLGAFGK